MKTMSVPVKAMGILMLMQSTFFIACKKDISDSGGNIPAGKTKLAVYLTDGPYDFDKVLIDIQQIAVKLDSCQRNWDEDRDQPGCDDDHDRRNSDCEIWDTLDIKPGVYDLLQLRNGVDTLLASGFVLNGKIKRIKFTLGDNNSVTVDSVDHPLSLKNGQHFVYLNLKRNHFDSLSSNDLQLFLDFNLAHSIKYSNGKYWLKPVLKPFGLRSSGEIEGRLKPFNSFGVVKAYNDTDTAWALPWHYGYFKIRGLETGTYNVEIQAINGYKDTTLTNVEVTKYRKTDAGTIELHK